MILMTSGRSVVSSRGALVLWSGCLCNDKQNNIGHLQKYRKTFYLLASF